MIPLPISDENPASRKPVVTMALIALNVAAWFYELTHGVELSTLEFGLIPRWIVSGTTRGILQLPGLEALPLQQPLPWPATVLTSMFMHGSWMHIIGNMWFLWIFGDNVEDAMGRGKYILFYLGCGVVAALAQIASGPSSLAPMVGASGAIAGVLGAYLMLFPHARVRCLWVLIIIVTTIYVPAWLLLGLWFVSQFFMPGPEVAWMAHVGGFATGFLLVRLLVPKQPRRRDRFPPLYSRA